MSRFHLVRYGASACVGQFTSAGAIRYERHQQVVLRTDRGLELGEVLTSPDAAGPGDSFQEGGLSAGNADGTILRRVTAADELLRQRIERHRQEAFQRCADRVAELGLPVVLIDVEHLFDGSSLVFYFVGEQLPELEEIVAELTERYEAEVQFRKFTQTVEEGCGPGCGTKETCQTSHASSGGCGSCATKCAIASARQTS